MMEKLAGRSVLVFALLVGLGLIVLAIMAVPYFPWQGWLSLVLTLVVFAIISLTVFADGHPLIWLGSLMFAIVAMMGPQLIPLGVPPIIKGSLIGLSLVVFVCLLVGYVFKPFGAPRYLVAMVLAFGASWIGGINQDRIAGAHIERANLIKEIKENQALIAEGEAASDERMGQVGPKLFAEQTDAEAMDMEGMTEVDAATLEEKLKRQKDAEARHKELMEEARKQAGDYSFRDRQETRRVVAEDEDESEDEEGVVREDDDAYADLGGEQEEEASEALMDHLVYGEKEAYVAKEYAGMSVLAARMVFWLSMLLAGIHYLRQANWTFPVLHPLPIIGGRWLDRLFEKEYRVHMQSGDPDVLALVQRTTVQKGETFICFTPAAALADGEVERWAWRSVGGGIKGLPTIAHMTDQNPKFFASSEFVFESAWFGRYAFTIHDPDRARKMLLDIQEMMRLRRETRAAARRTLNIIWAMSEPLPAQVFESFAYTAGIENIRLIVISPDAPPADRRENYDHCYDEDFFAGLDDD